MLHFIPLIEDEEIIINVIMELVIVKKIKEALISKNLTISCCESASSGTLSNLLTSVDGSSQYFKGAIISYSNEIKQNVVHIDKSIIEQYGAVSRQVAELMAQNTNRIMHTDICISITGNASPTNLIENKPACMYYVGITLIDQTYVYEFNLEENERQVNKLNIAVRALETLLQLLDECKA